MARQCHGQTIARRFNGLAYLQEVDALRLHTVQPLLHGGLDDGSRRICFAEDTPLGASYYLLWVAVALSKLTL